MTIDHDAIAARVRQDREKGSPGPWHQAEDNPSHIDYTDQFVTCWSVADVHTHCGHPIDGSSSNARRIATLPDLEAAYLDLYDEVKRLRAEARQWCGHTYTVDGRAALVMAFETAARQWRETYCLASPGGDEEFHAILSGFDTAVGMFRAALKGDRDA